MNCLLILNIFYKDAFNIYTPDGYEKILASIIKESEKYDISILANDSHDYFDKEFKYLPRHCLNRDFSSIQNDSFIKQLSSKYFLSLSKNTLSAVGTEHNKQTILNYHFDRICVCGFSGCIDILPTCFDLIDMKMQVECKPDLIGDFSKEYQEHAVKTLNLFNLCQ